MGANISISYLKNLRVYNFRKHANLYYKESKKYVNPLAIDNNFHEEYSFLSVGSDQVWGWFTHSIADFVFLKFAPLYKRIAFSPSFGSSAIDEKYRSIFTQGLQGFKCISIRESSGAQIIKDFTNKNAEVLCDPTMCISKSEWLKFAASHKKKPKRKFILTYFLGEPSPKVINIINSLSKEFEIVNLNSFQSPKFYTITPSEWVDYINSASLVLTDSFHSVVFSIIMQTPFAVYERVGGKSMQTRISNILEKFNMSNRFEIPVNDLSLFNMDFSHVESIINIEKANVYTFLQKSLNQ